MSDEDAKDGECVDNAMEEESDDDADHEKSADEAEEEEGDDDAKNRERADNAKEKEGGAVVPRRPMRERRRTGRLYDHADCSMWTWPE